MTSATATVSLQQRMSTKILHLCLILLFCFLSNYFISSLRAPPTPFSHFCPTSLDNLLPPPLRHISEYWSCRVWQTLRVLAVHEQPGPDHMAGDVTDGVSIGTTDCPLAWSFLLMGAILITINCWPVYLGVLVVARIRSLFPPLKVLSYWVSEPRALRDEQATKFLTSNIEQCLP